MVHQRVLGLAFALLVTAAVVAVDSHGSGPQDHSTHGKSASTAEGNVATDRVIIGPEYLPRRPELPNKLIVPAGQVVELPADATYDYIEVAGTLKASRVHDTTTAIHTPRRAAWRVSRRRHASRPNSVRSQSRLDRARCTDRHGQGSVPVGKRPRELWPPDASGLQQDRLGGIRQQHCRLVPQRRRSPSAPSGWQVGDELLIPDTAAPPRTATPTPRRESKVTIAAIHGTN